MTDREARRALVIDRRTPNRDGASPRIFEQVRILVSLGFEVTLATEHPASGPFLTDRPIPEDLRGVDIYPGTPEECLRRRGEEYDVVMLSGGVRPAEKYVDAAREHAVRALVVPDTLDVHEVRGSAASFAARKDVFLLGEESGSAPDMDAVLHYLDNVHPLVKRYLPGVRFHVAGAPSELLDRAGDDVIVAGHNPAAYFDRCRLSVAPFRSGPGAENGVLESVGRGVPVVASKAAVEGTCLRHRHDVLVADEPETFCAAIVELYGDEDLWNRLSANGLGTVARYYAFESVRGRLAGALDAPRLTEGPLVSVVVPVYNHERYLSATLDSVSDQDYRPIEIIVVDDGSTDATASIARSHEAVRYVYQANAGLSAARNAGIAAARGEFVAFLDSDDLWTSNKLGIQVDHLLQHPEFGYVLSAWRNFVEPGADLVSWGVLDPLSGHDAYLPSSILARRTVFDEVGWFDPGFRMGEDLEWFARAKNAGIRRFVVPEVLAYRRLHASNLSARWWFDHRKLLLKIARKSIGRRTGESGSLER